MLSQPNYQQYKGAQKHRSKKNDKTVNETGYHDHDMQTDIAFEHLEQIT